MKIHYQNRLTETAAFTLIEFVKERNLDAEHTIFEFNGEIIAPGGNLDLPLEDGDILNAFRIVAGG